MGETIINGVATAGLAVASGVTLGQIDALNDPVVGKALNTGRSGEKCGEKLVDTTSDLLDATPGVGHLKGAIHYACGDNEGGDAAMKSASRTTGVVAGGIVGIAGGPAGMIAGGIAGGAAMDGITTGVESAIHGKYCPNGSIAAWTAVATENDPQKQIGGLVGGLVTPVLDGVTGYATGSAVKELIKAKSVRPLNVIYDGEPMPEGGWLENGEEVFRGDKRYAAGNGQPGVNEEFFENGIKTRGECAADGSADAHLHTTTNSANEPFISTSKELEIAKEFGKRDTRSFVARILCEDGVDINKTAEILNKYEDVQYPGQHEVSIYQKVPASNIKGIIEFGADGSQTWHPNPNFDASAVGNTVYYLTKRGVWLSLVCLILQSRKSSSSNEKS